MDKPLDGMEQWMVNINLEYVKTEGLDVVAKRLRAHGYDRVATALEKAARDNDPVLWQVRTLGGGTISRLIGSTLYADIDKAEEGLVEFVLQHPLKFKSWQDAWEAYSAQQKNEA